MKLLEASLKRHEGYRDRIYRDTKGNPTGGYGHHFAMGSKLSDEIWELILKYDIANAVSDFNSIPKKYRDCLNEARRRVIVEMIFNMGLLSVMTFRNMWKAIEQKSFGVAAYHMLNSKWAREDVGHERSEFLANVMETGVWPMEDRD